MRARGGGTISSSAIAELYGEDAAPTALRAVAMPHPVPWPKRLLDVTVATVALVVLSPLLLLAAALVAITSPGPVVYRQQRYGRGGHTFTIIKLRTMVDGADERIRSLLVDPSQRDHLAAHGKLLDDPRITPVGRILRLLSIDELPQLVNVLKGDMSLVGPRPRWDVEELGRYGDDLDAYLSVLPGLTGPWQVAGRNRLPDTERVALDVAYAQSHSLWTDLRLLARTVPVLLWPFGRGAA